MYLQKQSCEAFQQHFSCIVKSFSKRIKWEWSNLVKQQERGKVKSVKVRFLNWGFQANVTSIKSILTLFFWQRQKNRIAVLKPYPLPIVFISCIEPFIRSALPLLALVTHARMMPFKCLLNMNATFSIAVSFNDIASRNQLSKNMYASTSPSYGICISCRNCSFTAQASATYITWASILLPCYFSANFRKCDMRRRVCNMRESVCDKIRLSLQQ